MHNVILIPAFINFNVQHFFRSTYIITSFTQLKRFTELARGILEKSLLEIINRYK